METMMAVQLGVIVLFCKVLSYGLSEELPCTPGFESKLLVLKVHSDHLQKGETLGRVIFNTCDGGTRIPFQSTDNQIDLNVDGTLMLKRSVMLQEGIKEFSVHAWESSGKKHTASVRIERVCSQGDHDMKTLIKTSCVQMESPSDDDLVLRFPESPTGLKRAKRGWVIPPFSVRENSRGPFPMRLVQIKSDYASETQMAYRITGEGVDLDPKGIFQIERLSGRLSVTQSLDREKKASYKIVVHATGVDVTSIIEKPMEIIVNVMDQNDNRPMFTQNPFTGNVPEAAEKGEVFMTVTATDADDEINTENADISYSIVSQDPPLPKPNMFTINVASGGISVLERGLDREQWSKYTLIITASDLKGQGLLTTGTAVITVTDSNDNPPQFEQTSYTVSFPENKVGGEVARLIVTDGDDSGSPAWSAKYRIISGDKGGFFNVSTGPSFLEGIITTVKPLDYEKTKQYVLSVIVVNDNKLVGALPTSTATVTVNVQDVNEPPEFNPKQMLIYKPEDLAVGTELVTYTATDPDIGKAQKITYKTGNDPSNWLTVSDAGLIRVGKPMDRESFNVKDGKYKAIILALDDGEPPATGTGTLIIELEDVNDNAPVIMERNINICNRESSPVLLSIMDKDGPPFGAPFSVEPQGEAKKDWSTSMNDTSTGFYLNLETQLEQGDYLVVLRVSDQQGLSQESTIQASVRNCEGEYSEVETTPVWKFCLG